MTDRPQLEPQAQADFGGGCPGSWQAVTTPVTALTQPASDSECGGHGRARTEPASEPERDKFKFESAPDSGTVGGPGASERAEARLRLAALRLVAAARLGPAGGPGSLRRPQPDGAAPSPSPSQPRLVLLSQVRVTGKFTFKSSLNLPVAPAGRGSDS